MSQPSQNTQTGPGSSSEPTLFEEAFALIKYTQVKYDRVARVEARSHDTECFLSLDINTELLSIGTSDQFTMVLAHTLNLDGTRDEETGGRGGSGKTGWRNVSQFQGTATLADDFDYVCHGRVFKFEDGGSGNVMKVHVSFGGLLLMLQGPFRRLTPLRMDHVYMLIKKVS